MQSQHQSNRLFKITQELDHRTPQIINKPKQSTTTISLVPYISHQTPNAPFTSKSQLNITNKNHHTTNHHQPQQSNMNLPTPHSHVIPHIFQRKHLTYQTHPKPNPNSKHPTNITINQQTHPTSTKRGHTSQSHAQLLAQPSIIKPIFNSPHQDQATHKLFKSQFST